jgi:hypothetical protein
MVEVVEDVLDPKSWTQPYVNAVKFWWLTCVLCQPLLFKLNVSDVAQGGMNAFVHMYLIEKLSRLSGRISVILILGQVNFLLFDPAHEPLGIAILPGSSDLGHTDEHSIISQTIDIGHGCIPDALIRVMVLWLVSDERPL